MLWITACRECSDHEICEGDPLNTYFQLLLLNFIARNYLVMTLGSSKALLQEIKTKGMPVICGSKDKLFAVVVLLVHKVC